MLSAIYYSVSPYLLQNNKTKWADFESLLQKKSSLSLSFKKHSNSRAFRKECSKGRLGLIYADSYHASVLLRQYGYHPLARALGQYDETLVVVLDQSALLDLEDLKPRMYLSISAEPINRLLGRLLMQPVELDEDDMVCRYHRTHLSVVRDLLLNKTDVGVISASNFDQLALKIKQKLRILVRSQTYLFSSLWMLSPGNIDQYPALAQTFNSMHRNRKGCTILKTFNTQSWLPVEPLKAAKMAELWNMLR
jgi:hypothetical protein